ncbi:hypothetical protein Maes01_02093 [Microbulbifer aestuariivivens]|uniref:Kazal-like domain-containing protein n=1 Tax=Microbulbifer aestuariivivens TaxID=1908308 RepID=A0ABP9WSG2_9GAMM
MKKFPTKTSILAICVLGLAVGACSPKKEEQKEALTEAEAPLSAPQAEGMESGPVGCCQEGPDACASPAYKQECLQTDGEFHEGKACDIEAGKCGDAP